MYRFQRILFSPNEKLGPYMLVCACCKMIYHEQYILLVFKIIPISLIASLSVFWQRSCQHPSFSPSCSLTSNSLRSGVPITWIKMARRVFQSFILIYLFLCVRLPMQMLVLASYIYRQII